MNPRRPRARDLLVKVIPTDTRFQIMRIAERGVNMKDLQLGLARSSSSEYRRRSLDYPIGIVNENLGKMLDTGLVKISKNNTIALTPLGREVFAATRDILFRGRAPEIIEPAHSKQRSNKQVYNRGPLTDLFSGRLAGRSISALLDFANEHRSTHSNWLDFDRSRQKAGLTTNLIRQGLIESEVPVKYTLRADPGRSDRGTAVVWGRGGGLLHDLTPQARSIGKLSKKDIDKFPTSRSSYTKEEVKGFRGLLVRKGVDASVANNITPTEAKIVWYISKGVHSQRDISRIFGTSQGSVADKIAKMAKKGFLSKRKFKFRVAENTPAAEFQPLTEAQRKQGKLETAKEIFPPDHVIEFLRALETIVKKNKGKIK